jgi:hypothetical protein
MMKKTGSQSDQDAQIAYCSQPLPIRVAVAENARAVAGQALLNIDGPKPIKTRNRDSLWSAPRILLP